MAPPTVLVVEHDPDLRETFIDWLPGSYRVHTAADGTEALAEVHAGVEVVVLDRCLPDIPGKAVLSRIRSRGMRCRVAMITGVVPDGGILEMPFDDYLVKPVDEHDLRSTVRSLLDRASFDQTVQERYALSARVVALEAEESPSQLERNDEYIAATARIEELNDKLNDLIDGSATRNMAALYYEIGRTAGPVVGRQHGAMLTHHGLSD